MGVSRSGNSVVLVGFGSERSRANVVATRRLAAAVAARGVFASVGTCFPGLDPSLDAPAAACADGETIIVPNFAGDGPVAETTLSQALDLLRGLPDAPARLRCTEPVGRHAAIADVLDARLGRLCAQAGLDRRELSVLLVAHGSRVSADASAAARAVARRLAERAGLAETRLVFLDQAPFSRDWAAEIGGSTVAAIPLFMGDGRHGGRDVPALFGLEPIDEARSGAEWRGPVIAAGRRVWCSRSLGSDPALVDLVIDLATRAADTRQPPPDDQTVNPVRMEE